MTMNNTNETIPKDLLPEQKVRVKIDSWLDEAGWKVVDRHHYYSNLPCAVEEGLMRNKKEADYLLFLNGRAVGVIEAKAENIELNDDVKNQAEEYTRLLPKWCAFVKTPLPMVYLCNGKTILFKDMRDPNGQYKTIKKMPRPYDIAKALDLLSIDYFSGMPVLKDEGLRECQYDAVNALEKSFAEDNKKALIVSATGSGKTFTACLTAYRMLSYTMTNRVLFLVDRNNLGIQAKTEFGKFRLTESKDAFDTIFSVERITSNKINKASVYICTIQRLFSLLTGKNNTVDEDNEEFLIDEDDNSDSGVQIELPENPKLPKDFFDLIIIDECHRSIYKDWRKVLEYFSNARLVGLTATPAPETMAFFNNNRVLNYTLHKSILQNVNVDHIPYRIKTQVSEGGGVIHGGEEFSQKEKYTGNVTVTKNQNDKVYTSDELNRTVINPTQIETIMRAYKDAIYSSLYPDREPNFDYTPKTLVFAQSEEHAQNIVKAVKKVFDKENDEHFVQSITYTSSNANQQIKDFRNSKDFRIAVTVTLVSTGTDIKPLEVVMFMRDVQSNLLFTQMVGRGVRKIGDDQLRTVTPNATSKDLFYVVDAVGVTEHVHTITTVGRLNQKGITVEKLLEEVCHGFLPDEYLHRLASILLRVDRRIQDNEYKDEFTKLTKGHTLSGIAESILKCYDDENNHLPPFVDINEPNLERKKLVKPLSENPDAREFFLKMYYGTVKTLLPGEDTLIYSGFSQNDAKLSQDIFETYIQQHQDEIEALRILYNQTEEPITYSMLEDLNKKLSENIEHFSINRQWESYAVLKTEHVKKLSGDIEKKALTNLIQLVRFGLKYIPNLVSLVSSSNKLFNLWCGQVQRSLTPEQMSLMANLVDYVSQNGFCSIDEIRNTNRTQAAQMIQAFGSKEETNAVIYSMAKFIIYSKSA